jgi:hypothetical protein
VTKQRIGSAEVVVGLDTLADIGAMAAYLLRRKPRGQSTHTLVLMLNACVAKPGKGAAFAVRKAGRSPGNIECAEGGELHVAGPD